MADVRDVLRGQFELTWSLFEYHLERLTPEDLLWEPAELCWTVRVDSAGGWRADWSDQALDPIPVPTIGWLSWHIGWWWSVAIAHARGFVPPERAAVRWPGDLARTLGWMRALHDDWAHLLDDADDSVLALPAAFPWPPETGRSMADLYGWVNAELMKNAAEIGQLRLLRAAEGADRMVG
ncbi:DinB family protein [Kribbella sancticallisti]|uniref:DinB family protein n=1 Tax=Kribbella sancticallisti TaxID=460087 RepID=A0ABP4QE75_9ACTN